jgi:hypothetical protein
MLVNYAAKVKDCFSLQTDFNTGRKFGYIEKPLSFSIKKFKKLREKKGFYQLQKKDVNKNFFFIFFFRYSFSCPSKIYLYTPVKNSFTLSQTQVNSIYKN